MSEMVDRVSAAICQAVVDSARLIGTGSFNDAVAIAAIAALREPTPEMIRAGARVVGMAQQDEADYVEFWRAMIDEVLR